MKKKIASIMCVTLMIGMVACAKDDNTATTAAPATTVAATEAPTQAATEAKEETTAPVENEATTEEVTDAPVAEDDLAAKLAAMFKEEIANSTDIMAIAEKLGSFDVCGYDCMAIEAKEGYLNGFSGEVTGFTSGAQFSPMIGSIPFIGYIFETDDAEALKASLASMADPRWNICTEAKDPVFEVVGNYVFVTMVPGEEEF